MPRLVRLAPALGGLIALACGVDSTPGERLDDVPAVEATADDRPSDPPVDDPCTVQAQAARRQGDDTQQIEVEVLTDQTLRQGGHELAVGLRVRLNRRVAALDSDVTGHAQSIAFGPDQVGTVLCFVRTRTHHPANPLLDYTTLGPVVRWDAQVWREWAPLADRMAVGRIYDADDINRANEEHGPSVHLSSFWASAHGEALEPIPES